MAQEIYGQHGTNVRGVLTYSTSQTNTGVTITASAALQRYQNYGAPYRIYIKIGSDSKSSIGVNEYTYSNWTTIHSCSLTKTITRTKSAQSITISSNYKGENYDGWIAGDYTGSKSVTITVPAKPSYTVSYNVNGGSGAPSSQTKWYGENLTLSSTKPTRTGYTFLGWGTSSTATSASYAAGGTYTANSGTTLYAIWSKTLTLSYDANEGSGAPASQSATIYNAATSYTFKISTAQPTRTDHTFKGWSTSSTATSASYSSGDSITLSSSTILYAVWELNKGYIKYNLDGGTGEFKQQEGIIGTEITIHEEIPTKRGYKFLYWSDGGTTEYGHQTDQTKTYKIQSNSVTLTAKWEKVYDEPIIISYSVKRVKKNDDGSFEEHDEGNFGLISCSYTFSSENENEESVTASVVITYNDINGEPCEEIISLSGTEVITTYEISQSELIFTFNLTDSNNGQDSKTFILPASFFIIDINKEGKSFSLGGGAQTENIPSNGLLQVYMDAIFKGRTVFEDDIKFNLDKIYPIGAIYLSFKTISPASLFGGDWERIENCFFWATSEDDTSGEYGNGMEVRGGESTHTLTIEEMPTHSHTYKRNTATTTKGKDHASANTAGEPLSGIIGNTGGGQPHNNMPPYIQIAAWRRVS